MASCQKLFGLSNRIFLQILQSKSFASSQLLHASTFTAKSYSTNAPAIHGKFSKLDDTLITQHKPETLDNLKDRRRRNVDRQMRSNEYGKGRILEDLRELEFFVRKFGRLDLNQVQRVIDSIKDELSSVESSMLLRCCGSFLISSSPSERQKLTKQVWNLIKEKGVDLNAQVYNSLMFTHLENGEQFSPYDILNDLENLHKIAPSKITYELLVAGFCEQGDISGARKIMDHMKANDLPLNHFVLNYLIRAHIKNNDIKGAKDIIETMSSHGLEATSDTYKMFLLSLAETGNMNALQEGLSEMQSKKLQLNAKSIYDIALASSKYKHYNNTKEILKMLRFCSDKNLMSNDSLNSALQLVAIGDVINAVEVLKEMDLDEETKFRCASRCLRKCLDNHNPVDKLFELHYLLIEEGFSNVSLPLLIHWSTTSCSQTPQHPNYQYQYGFKMINYLKSKGEEIRTSHYFPLLNHSLSSDNLQQIYAVTKAMCKNCVSVDDPIMPLLTVKVLPTLTQKFKLNIDDVIIELQKFSCNSTILDCLRVGHHISNADFETAVKLINDGSKFSQRFTKNQITEAFYINRSTKHLVELVSAINKKLRRDYIGEFNSMLLLNITGHPDATANIAAEVIQAFQQGNLRISRNCAGKLEEALIKLNVQPELLEIINLLTKNEAVNEFNQTLLKMSTAELEKKLEENNRSVAIKKSLLFKYTTEGDVSKAESMKKELDEQQFTYPPQLLRQLGFMHARYKQDKQTALDYLHLINKDHPSMLRYSNLLIEICILQLLEGQNAEALELLLEHGDKMKPKLKEDGFSDNVYMIDSCLRLLQALTGKNPYAGETEKSLDDAISDVKFERDGWVTYDLMEALFNCGFIKKGAYTLLNYTMDLFLKYDNLDSLLACYERCVLRYGDAPLYVKVLDKISRSDDINKLNKAMELTCKVYDEVDVNRKLFFIYLSQKKEKEALNIFKSFNKKFDFESMAEDMRKLVKFNREDDLLLLEQITRGSTFHLESIFQLIRLYAKFKNPEKVELAYALLGENGLKLKANMVSYIASVYSTLNIAMPQQLQQYLDTKSKMANDIMHVLDINEESPLAKDSKVLKKLIKRHKDEEILDAAVEGTELNGRKRKVEDISIDQDVKSDKDAVKSNMSENETSSKKVAISELVAKIMKLDVENKKKEAALALGNAAKQLLNSRDNKGLRNLIFEISETRNLYLMDELRSLKMNNKFVERFFNKKLFIAYIHNQKGSEIVDYLDSNADKLQIFVSLDVLTELNNQQPITFNKLEDLILKEGDTRSNFALVHLHAFYLQQNLTQKAEAMLKENPLLKKRLEVRKSRSFKQQSEDQLDQSSIDQPLIDKSQHRDDQPIVDNLPHTQIKR